MGRRVFSGLGKHSEQRQRQEGGLFVLQEREGLWEVRNKVA